MALSTRRKARVSTTEVTAPRRSQPLVSNGVAAMVLLVFTEVMFFAGLLSAFEIMRSKATSWPPMGQPRLPFEETAVNTTALLVSGVVMVLAERAWRDSPSKALPRLVATLVLGTFFVGFQGVEWLGLLRQGMTITSGPVGSFFYVIVGTHAVHALIGLATLAWAILRLRQGQLSRAAFATVQVFWYFVVLLWPMLYFKVYR